MNESLWILLIIVTFTATKPSIRLTSQFWLVKQKQNVHMNTNIHAGWNGIIKNISGEPISSVEESLFQKGKKFCPVELDPPVIRI
jgi:hypothetical protein